MRIIGYRALFLTIPLVSLFFSVFLFLTVLSTKKNKLLNSFLLLLFCFVIWCLGSSLLRLETPPGIAFWFYVSATGIFMVPYSIYNFLFHYTNQKGTFARTIWAILWLVLVVLNLFGFFFQTPLVTTADGIPHFSYGITPFIIIPTILALWILVASGRMVYRYVHKDGMPLSDFYPFMIGIVIMFAGLVIQAFLELRGLVSDALFCGINSICIYYALYKKRLITPQPFSSKAPVFLMAVAFTAIIYYFYITPLMEFLQATFSFSTVITTLFVAVFFSVTVFLFSALIQYLMTKLFVKDEELREQELKKFSQNINKTLNASEVVNMYLDFLLANAPEDKAYIFRYDQSLNGYSLVACSEPLDSTGYFVKADNPLIPWLTEQNRSITLTEFSRTRHYIGMWEKEKELFKHLQAELVIPSVDNKMLVSFTVFTARNKHKKFSYPEISFFESAASILSIAFKNASLYATIQDEARRDPLTGLFNRGYFLQKLSQEFSLCKNSSISLAQFSLDDFRLYNELYGPHEGDRILKVFADIVSANIAHKGTVARYGGKELMVSLPFLNASSAKDIVEQCRAQFNSYMANDPGQVNRILTFSAGICSYPVSAKNMDDLLSFASMATYSAKKNGKNRTVIYAGPTFTDDRSREDGALNKRQLADSNSQTIFALTAAIDAKDHYTFSHSNMVSLYASILAQAIGLDSEHVEIIRQAGLLHDVGKIGIPESILGKPGKLEDEEFEIMKQHVIRSISIIKYLPSLDYVIPAAIGHHERWDGKGYPRNLAGENIPIGARCLCIADAFDAMISERSYKKPMSVEAALKETERCLGTQFDPNLGRTFIHLVRTGQIPIGGEG